MGTTANLTGLNNLEIDLLQENLDRELKKGIKGTSANKIPKAIKQLSQAQTLELLADLTVSPDC